MSSNSLLNIKNANINTYAIEMKMPPIVGKNAAQTWRTIVMMSNATLLNLGNSFILPPRIKATIKDKQITSKSISLASKGLRKNTTQASGVSSKIYYPIWKFAEVAATIATTIKIAANHFFISIPLLTCIVEKAGFATGFQVRGQATKYSLCSVFPSALVARRVDSLLAPYRPSDQIQSVLLCDFPSYILHISDKIRQSQFHSLLDLIPISSI